MDLKRKLEDGYTPDPNSGCWLWVKAWSSEGYGQLHNGVTVVYAHRLSYELYHGVSLSGKQQLDHLCRVRCCVNPLHLEAVTRRENIIRGVGPTALKARQVNCLKGHPLSGENLRVTPAGYRVCRECHKEHNRRYLPEWRKRKKSES